MIDAGLPLAIASDYNPGSAPSGNMSLMIALACIKMKLTPEEAINAATINTAKALELTDQVGSITKGKIANVFITTEIPSIGYLPYAFGSNLVNTVILNGKLIPKGRIISISWVTVEFSEAATVQYFSRESAAAFENSSSLTSGDSRMYLQ